MVTVKWDEQNNSSKGEIIISSGKEVENKEANEYAEIKTEDDRIRLAYDNYNVFLNDNDKLFDDKFPYIGGGATALYITFLTNNNLFSIQPNWFKAISILAIIFVVSAILMHLLMPLLMRNQVKNFKDALHSYLAGETNIVPDIDIQYQKSYKRNNTTTIIAYTFLVVGAFLALLTVFITLLHN